MADKAQLGRKGQRTRGRLLACGFSLFVKEGVATVSLDDILRYSEVKKGAFYYYFDSKDEFLRACFEECYLRPVTDAMNEFAGTEASSIADLLYFFTNFAVRVQEKMDALLGEHAVELNDVFANIAYLSRESDFMARHFVDFHERQRTFVRDCLVRMQQRGLVDDAVNCDEIAQLMCACREGAFTMASRGMTMDFAAEMTTAMRYFERLVAPRSPARPG